MLNSEIVNLQNGDNTLRKGHCFNLDTDLDGIIVLKSDDVIFGEVLYHKIIDCMVERIHSKNLYKDFSHCLENINSFILNWKHQKKIDIVFDAVIALYHKDTFYFSSVGEGSCLLFNSGSELIEVTDKFDLPKNFNYISSGDITPGETLLLSHSRLLGTLSREDLSHVFYESTALPELSHNLNYILQNEFSHDQSFVVMQKEKKLEELSPGLREKGIRMFMLAMDNIVIKKAWSYVLLSKDVFLRQPKKIKRYIFAGGLGVCVVLLYVIVSGFFSIASSAGGIEDYEQKLTEAKYSISQASDSMNNSDMFNFHVDEVEKRIRELKEKEMFLSDVDKLQYELANLQKQFNGILPFYNTDNKAVYSFSADLKIVKNIWVGNLHYLVHSTGIVGPFTTGTKAINTEFEEILDTDEFVDATPMQNEILLMTKSGKVARFNKQRQFNFVDVEKQPVWAHSPLVASFNSNIYILSDDKNQILRHTKKGSSFMAGSPYLKQQDTISVGQILSIAIDGGIYVLKQDGSMVKLFKNPKYRLESLTLNKLPRNYDFSKLDPKTPPRLVAGATLNNVYMQLGNRILIFQPNTRHVKDTKSLNFLGQIEGVDVKIESFDVKNDGELYIASSGKIHKLQFEIMDDTIILK